MPYLHKLYVVSLREKTLDVLVPEPANFTVHPPPRTADGGFIFFV